MLSPTYRTVDKKISNSWSCLSSFLIFPKFGGLTIWNAFKKFVDLPYVQHFSLHVKSTKCEPHFCYHSPQTDKSLSVKMIPFLTKYYFLWVFCYAGCLPQSSPWRTISRFMCSIDDWELDTRLSVYSRSSRISSKKVVLINLIVILYRVFCSYIIVDSRIYICGELTREHIKRSFWLRSFYDGWNISKGLTNYSIYTLDYVLRGERTNFSFIKFWRTAFYCTMLLEASAIRVIPYVGICWKPKKV